MPVPKIALIVLRSDAAQAMQTILRNAAAQALQIVLTSPTAQAMHVILRSAAAAQAMQISAMVAADVGWLFSKGAREARDHTCGREYDTVCMYELHTQHARHSCFYTHAHARAVLVTPMPRL